MYQVAHPQQPGNVRKVVLARGKAGGGGAGDDKQAAHPRQPADQVGGQAQAQYRLLVTADLPEPQYRHGRLARQLQGGPGIRPLLARWRRGAELAPAAQQLGIVQLRRAQALAALLEGLAGLLPALVPQQQGQQGQAGGQAGGIDPHPFAGVVNGPGGIVSGQLLQLFQQLAVQGAQGDPFRFQPQLEARGAAAVDARQVAGVQPRFQLPQSLQPLRVDTPVVAQRGARLVQVDGQVGAAQLDAVAVAGQVSAQQGAQFAQGPAQGRPRVVGVLPQQFAQVVAALGFGIQGQEGQQGAGLAGGGQGDGAALAPQAELAQQCQLQFFPGVRHKAPPWVF